MSPVTIQFAATLSVEQALECREAKDHDLNRLTDSKKASGMIVSEEPLVKQSKRQLAALLYFFRQIPTDAQ